MGDMTEGINMIMVSVRGWKSDSDWVIGGDEKRRSVQGIKREKVSR